MFKKFLLTTTTDTAIITTKTITAIHCLSLLFSRTISFWKLLRVRPCRTKREPL